MSKKNDYLAFLQKISEEDETSIRKKCRALGYTPLKTQLAIKFFIYNEKPRDVWLWMLDKNYSNIEWDSVKKIKYRMKKELFPSI